MDFLFSQQDKFSPCKSLKIWYFINISTKILSIILFNNVMIQDTNSFLTGGKCEMKRTLFLLILIVFFTTSLVGCNNQKSSVSEDKKVNYQLQEQCGKSCKEYFIKTYGELDEQTDVDGWWKNDFNSHYNKNLNKCFILVDSKNSYKMNRKRLLEINENKDYGKYWKGSNGVTTNCYVLDKKCDSEEEWNTLVRPYMEE